VRKAYKRLLRLGFSKQRAIISYYYVDHFNPNALGFELAMINQDFSNRIKKRYSYLKKWARREAITCFRVYEKDLPDYPLILDWIDGEAVAWIYDRKKDETDDQKEAFTQSVKATILQALDLEDACLHLKTRRRQKGLGVQYEKLKRLNIKKVITESGLKFELNLEDYLDTGLFLDHRSTRALCRDLAKGKRFLNLFSYTAAFTCYAIDGGAISTTSVDLSTSYTKWAERNLALNGFGQRESDRLITENCLSFVKLEAAKTRYDLIFCDPPHLQQFQTDENPFFRRRRLRGLD